MTGTSAEKRPDWFVIIGKVFFTLILIVMIVTALACFVLYFIGVSVHCAEDNNMAPDYPENSLVLVNRVEPSVIQTGDIVTYVIDEKGTLKIAEVTAKDFSSRQFRLNNHQSPEETVLWDNVIGKTITAVPHCGGIYRFLTAEENRGTLILIAAILVVSSLVFEIIAKRRSSRN